MKRLLAIFVALLLVLGGLFYIQYSRAHSKFPKIEGWSELESSSYYPSVSTPEFGIFEGSQEYYFSTKQSIRQASKVPQNLGYIYDSSRDIYLKDVSYWPFRLKSFISIDEDDSGKRLVLMHAYSSTSLTLVNK